MSYGYLQQERLISLKPLVPKHHIHYRLLLRLVVRLLHPKYTHLNHQIVYLMMAIGNRLTSSCYHSGQKCPDAA